MPTKECDISVQMAVCEKHGMKMNTQLWRVRCVNLSGISRKCDQGNFGNLKFWQFKAWFRVFVMG